MRIQYKDDDPGLKEAVEFVNQLSNYTRFWDDISAQRQFADSQLDAAEITHRLQACDHIVEVRHWRPALRPRTVAVTDRAYPYTILYNIKNFGRNSVAEKVHTLVHEFVHNVDLFHDGNATPEYTHDRGPFAATAPYWIGDLASSYYRAEAGEAEADLLKQEADRSLYADDLVGVIPDEVGDGVR